MGFKEEAGLGCLRVGELECGRVGVWECGRVIGCWNDLVLESSKVLGLESCMGGFDLGKGQGV